MVKIFSRVHDTAASSTENLSHEDKLRQQDSPAHAQRKKRITQYTAIGAAVLVLALALGLGLGLGLNRTKATSTYDSESYSLVEQYQGTTFFDKFDYFSDADPTNGFVIYQLRANANYENYTYASNTSAIIRPATEALATGINSVRIQSTKNYTQGLFLLDLVHMPFGCGTWPAFWTVDETSWPSNGEIDILEGVNANTHNEMTLHTAAGCSMKHVARNETGTVLSTNCASEASDTGCGVNDTTHAGLSYGQGFNDNGGGFFAMDWRSNGIRIWFFPRNALPADLQVISDDPTSTAVPSMADWGTSVANFPNGNCDIDSHFKNHKIVFDLTFCGDYAGAGSIWNASSCYNAQTAPTCETYMKTSPADLSEAYFEIKSLNVYQFSGEGATEVGSEYAVTTTTSATVQVATSSAAAAAAAASAK